MLIRKYYISLTDEPIEERLSLSVLKQLDKISEIGYKLIPEHVETRSLYRSDRPNIEQVNFLNYTYTIIISNLSFYSTSGKASDVD